MTIAIQLSTSRQRMRSRSWKVLPEGTGKADERGETLKGQAATVCDALSLLIGFPGLEEPGSHPARDLYRPGQTVPGQQQRAHSLLYSPCLRRAAHWQCDC